MKPSEWIEGERLRLTLEEAEERSGTYPIPDSIQEDLKLHCRKNPSYFFIKALLNYLDKEYV
jgi:hypothetical protein